MEKIDKDVAKLIDDAVDSAKAAPLPTAKELMTDVYVKY
jgi:pyruvate dehydrogenase E1 component alpha subunit